MRLDPEARVPTEVVRRYRNWVARRADGVPAHHLTGRCPFWGRKFLVTPETLIPRPETELLVTAALELGAGGAAAVLDVGTGTGCLAVTLALERPGWRVVATDVSPGALWVARANVRGLGARVALVRCDLASALGGAFDLVVANLPYVPAGELPHLPLEVRREPRAALDGGPRGLRLVHRLVADLPRLLRPGGHALLELGPDQAPAVAEAARRAGLLPRPPIHDLAGIARILPLEAAGPARR